MISRKEQHCTVRVEAGCLLFGNVAKESNAAIQIEMLNFSFCLGTGRPIAEAEQLKLLAAIAQQPTRPNHIDQALRRNETCDEQQQRSIVRQIPTLQELCVSL